MAVSGEQPIVIKKVKKVVGGGHHGGAWKVAYADFVTAMMAFFLLMWLLNTTSPEQKQGIADYFAPASISSSTSGSGGILGGTSLGDDGAKADGKMSVIQQMAPEAPTETDKDGQSSTSASLDSASEQALRDALAKKEQDSFASAAQSLRQSLQDMPELAELSKQIMIDQTPEGLRIQLIDQDGRSMFKENSREPNDRARILLRAVAKVINQLPNRITISGHTSASAAGKRADSDWALSAERADASRQVLRGAGVDEDRIYQVSGKANSEPLYADDPTLAGNRRISIVLLREKPVLPDGL
ncbi:flagellar motor protein MotB [Caulobacter sp. UNC279MFTsu5.1]|uniref:flagellar motor protein MotB n=1 Tax=Caulobacter sp. UNC279MFTsu5.1 TaxID=1502775 RepID=UPI0008E4C15F|nr:flagellar motor protein MotB [Caulobacter sp. UNC279MFTsu5.1]SFJ78499.1 chemotaxis protein MotB [Caulobacter sp. UNC279MFTsu5.1]